MDTMADDLRALLAELYRRGQGGVRLALQEPGPLDPRHDRCIIWPIFWSEQLHIGRLRISAKPPLPSRHNFRKNPNRFRLDDPTSTVGEKEQTMTEPP